MSPISNPFHLQPIPSPTHSISNPFHLQPIPSPTHSISNPLPHICPKYLYIYVHLIHPHFHICSSPSHPHLIHIICPSHHQIQSIYVRLHLIPIYILVEMQRSILRPVDIDNLIGSLCTQVN